MKDQPSTEELQARVMALGVTERQRQIAMWERLPEEGRRWFAQFRVDRGELGPPMWKEGDYIRLRAPGGVDFTAGKRKGS